jgi:hypothetical protein
LFLRCRWKVITEFSPGNDKGINIPTDKRIQQFIIIFVIIIIIIIISVISFDPWLFSPSDRFHILLYRLICSISSPPSPVNRFYLPDIYVMDAPYFLFLLE